MMEGVDGGGMEGGDGGDDGGDDGGMMVEGMEW